MAVHPAEKSYLTRDELMSMGSDARIEIMDGAIMPLAAIFRLPAWVIKKKDGDGEE